MRGFMRGGQAGAQRAQKSLDDMAAIGAKIADYVANQRQKDLLACLSGIFGTLGTTSSAAAFFGLTIDGESGDTPTTLSPRHVAEARSLLGDQGDKLAAVAMHSKVYYDLVERKAIDYVSTLDARGTSTTQSGGSIAGAYGGDSSVPTYMGLRVIVSDDVQTEGTGNSTEYATYFFTQGAIASGEQLGMQTETDRDILAKSDAMSIDLHYCYHPVGAKWGVTTSNPDRATLATVGNWSRVYELKNLGIVRATNTSNFD
jgi:hypothetical protein